MKQAQNNYNWNKQITNVHYTSDMHHTTGRITSTTAIGLDWAVFYVPANTVYIGYMGDGFYRSKDPTDSIKVLKEHTVYTINRKNTIITQ